MPNPFGLLQLTTVVGLSTGSAVCWYALGILLCSTDAVFHHPAVPCRAAQTAAVLVLLRQPAAQHTFRREQQLVFVCTAAPATCVVAVGPQSFSPAMAVPFSSLCVGDMCIVYVGAACWCVDLCMCVVVLLSMRAYLLRPLVAAYPICAVQ